MNDIQTLIDRQLGIYCRLNYDHALRRLAVREAESYYGLQAPAVGAAAAAAAPLDHDPPIFACRFAEARGYEHILALANEDGRVAIQNTMQTGAEGGGGGGALETFQCHNNAVFDLAWTPTQMNFVTVSGDHTACLWDVADGSPKRVLMFSSHTKSVKTAVFRPAEPSVFATGARDGHILVWDTRAGAAAALVLKPDNCLMNCHSSFAPKTPGSHSKRPRVDTQRAVSVTGLVFQDDRTLLSCGECDGNIKVWDLRKNYSLYTREPLPKRSIPYCGSSTRNGYTNLIVDDARIRLYASCMDDVIYCFNISTYSALPERRYVGHENRTFYIKTGLSPDCLYLVSGSSDKHAYVWSVRAARPLVRLAGHAAEVTCAAWRRGADPLLVTCSDDARHKLWRVGRERQLGLQDDDACTAAAGRAEVVPLSDAAALPQWGTPSALRRRAAAPATPASQISTKRARLEHSAKKTKRCLADLMNACRTVEEDEIPTKRTRSISSAQEPEPRLLPAGTKRARDATPDCSPSKRRHLGSATPDCWSCTPLPGPGARASFMSPTKNYEKKTCRILSSRSPRAISPGAAAAARSPVKVSPSKVRTISFSCPTEDLPNFVLTGEAPHLRLMSPPPPPARRRRDTTDWLTAMLREKKLKAASADKDTVVPTSPKENAPPPHRRNSVTEKTPKSNKKTRTLLKYFSIANKNK